MALGWLVHSACHVLGYPKDVPNNVGSYQQEGDNGCSSGVTYDQSSEVSKGEQLNSSQKQNISTASGFQMPLHYPRYTKADYEKMEEWKVDLLLREYGLSFKGSLDEKRAYAMGAFLWPQQY